MQTSLLVLAARPCGSLACRPQQRPQYRRAASRRAVAPPPRALLDFLKWPRKQEAVAEPDPRQEAVQRLLSSVEGTRRGLDTSKEQQAEILEAVAALKVLGSDDVTTDADTLSATWALCWTTEKETLFILEKAGVFGTTAGDVYQVIDVEAGTLQNVITFPPEGAFIVDSDISIAGPQRTEFQFTSAALKLPGGRKLRLPPFGKGWFDTIYVDDEIRVAQDSRGDTLIVTRDGPPQRFE